MFNPSDNIVRHVRAAPLPACFTTSLARSDSTLRLQLDTTPQVPNVSKENQGSN